MLQLKGLCKSLQVSDTTVAESFLSEVIRRNRPRVILFSPHRNPSLRYKLAAFAHKKVADCAFVSTHQAWLSQQVLARFEVHPGAKELLVFKEESGSEPSLLVEVSPSLFVFSCHHIFNMHTHTPQFVSHCFLYRVLS